jgi:hypothetical protein
LVVETSTGHKGFEKLGHKWVSKDSLPGVGAVAPEEHWSNHSPVQCRHPRLEQAGLLDDCLFHFRFHADQLGNAGPY